MEIEKVQKLYFILMKQMVGVEKITPPPSHVRPVKK